MAEKVEAFTSRAYNLAEDFRELMPEMYYERHPSDPVGLAWREAMAAAVDCYRAIGQLEKVLVFKAIKAEDAAAKRDLTP